MYNANNHISGLVKVRRFWLRRSCSVSYTTINSKLCMFYARMYIWICRLHVCIVHCDIYYDLCMYDGNQCEFVLGRMLVECCLSKFTFVYFNEAVFLIFNDAALTMCFIGDRKIDRVRTPRIIYSWAKLFVKFVFSAVLSFFK